MISAKKIGVSVAVLLAGTFCGNAADLKLPPPQTSGGMPLLDALSQRRTNRAISDKPLPKELLSSLLWAANGVNRPAEGRRTAPTALNRQEYELYVLLPEGSFRYDAAENTLVEVSGEANAGPMQIALVADSNKQKELKYQAVDAGFIGQNIYLFCAANQLATVFKGGFNAKVLKEKLKLDSHQNLMFVQLVGYPI